MVWSYSKSGMAVKY